MKKTNIRVRHNGGKNVPSSQARKTTNPAPGNAPASLKIPAKEILDREGWHLFVMADAPCVTNLWAAPGGQLYLWDEPGLHHEPQPVTVDQAGKWVAQHFPTSNPELQPPTFPDGSDADRFTDACMKVAHEEEQQRSQRIWKAKMELETVVAQVDALLSLLGNEIESIYEHGVRANEQEAKQIIAGLYTLERTTADRLHAAFKEIHLATGGVR